MITLYADGSSSLKSGFCGWAVAGDRNGQDVAFMGFLKGTNQIAELKAIIYAMRMIPKGEHGIVITDSQYAIKSMTEWWGKWEYNGFLNSSGNVISNYDLIRSAHEIFAARRVEFRHVRGHTGIPGNERVDKLAQLARHIGEGKIPEYETSGAILVRA